jgi:hypothetical protein
MGFDWRDVQKIDSEKSELLSLKLRVAEGFELRFWLHSSDSLENQREISIKLLHDAQLIYLTELRTALF